MKEIRVLLLVAVGLIGPFPVGALAQEALPPPFDLRWGDTPARLLAWADDLKLDKIWKEPGDEPGLKILMIQPRNGSLPDHDASMVEARFRDGRLFEVGVHYTFPGSEVEFVRANFVELRKTLALRHGQFRSGGVKREIDGGVAVKSEAFRVTPAKNRSLVLAITEVRDEKRQDAAAKFTVVYHNGDIRKAVGPPEIDQRLGAGGPEDALGR